MLHFQKIHFYTYTHETPAFGGISLAFRGSGAFGGDKRKKNFGTPAAPYGFNNFRRVMGIPNMCLVLKLDDGKVVSIANEQSDRQNHTAIQYRIII